MPERGRQSSLDTLSGTTTKLQDTTTEKIFQMLKLGVSRATLVSGIELLKEVSCTSVAAEQGHGSCATVRRFHGTATGHTISCRAMLHQGLFFFNQDHLLQHQLKLEKRLGMLERQEPQKTSAYAMFFKEFHATTRLQLSTRYDQSFGQSQQVLTAASRLWSAMIPKQKAYYEDLKVHFVQEKHKSLKDVKEDIMAQLVLERHRVLKAKQKCVWSARFLSGTRFNDRDLQRLQVWITRGEGMAQNNFHKVLQDMFESPVEPPMYEQGFFESCEKVAAQRPALQSWARAVADNRDCFLDCIFIQASDTSQGFMYMYCTKNPKFVHFKIVKKVISQQVIPFVDLSAPFEALEASCARRHEHAYAMGRWEFVGSDDLPWRDSATISVIPDCVVVGTRVVSGDVAKLLPEYVQQWCLPIPVEAPAVARPAAKRAKNSATEELQRRHPWLADYINKPAQLAKPYRAGDPYAAVGAGVADAVLFPLPSSQEGGSEESLEEQRWRMQVIFPRTTSMSKSEVVTGQLSTNMLHMMQCQAKQGVDCQKSSVLHMAFRACFFCLWPSMGAGTLQCWQGHGVTRWSSSTPFGLSRTIGIMCSRRQIMVLTSQLMSTQSSTLL